jgi:hypothetical protein
MPQKKDPSSDDLESSVDDLFEEPAKQENRKPGNTGTSKDGKNEKGSDPASAPGASRTDVEQPGSEKGPETSKEPQHNEEEPVPEEDSFFHVADNPEKSTLWGGNVPKRVIFEIGMMKQQLRRITDEKVTKTNIVEAALRMCAQEFEENGEEGLVTELIRRIRDRSG